MHIAQQLLAAARFGRGPTVALGGGRGEFLPIDVRDPEEDDKVGQRLDGRNLVAEWQQAHPQGAYVTNTQQLKAAADAPQLLGLFEYDHMQFEHDRRKDDQGEPSLAELTRAAIRTLSGNPNGFVLLVAGLAAAAGVLILCGLYMINPNEAAAIQLVTAIRCRRIPAEACTAPSTSPALATDLE